MFYLTIGCKIINLTACIATNDKYLYDKIKELFDLFNLSYQKSNINTITVLYDLSEYTIYVTNKQYVAKNITEALFLIYEVVDYFSKINSYPYYVWHGGLVAYNNQAIGILAPTRTGKSTMVTEFMLNGAQYLSDDYIFYDKKYVYDFPLPIRLRNINHLSDNIKDYIMIEGINPYSNEYEYLVTGRKSFSNSIDLTTLKSFIIIDRKPGEPTAIKKLNQKDAYLEIVHNGKSINENDIKKMNILSLSLVKTIPVYKLFYSDVKDAVGIIKEKVLLNNDFYVNNNQCIP